MHRSARRLFLLACLTTAAVAVPAAGCGKADSKKPTEDRRAALQQQLRQGGRAEVAAAAAEYRELMGESPDALRTIADAYLRVSDEAGELEAMRAVVARGQGTAADRRRLLALAVERSKTDEALYRTGLTWLDEIAAAEPWCATFAQLVEWTSGRPEHAAALDRALAGCPRDLERGRWLAERAARPASPTRGEDLCSAVAHGATDLAATCVQEGKAPWQVAFAKAMLMQDVLANLRIAAASQDATVFVLLKHAQTPGLPLEEACASLERARAIEVSWLPRAGDPSAIEGRYQGLKQQLPCR
jgi:hypothetical protein